MLAVLNVILIIFSAISFLGFGYACFGSAAMKREFERYRLGPWRSLIGALQLAGALGLLVGLNQPLLGRAAAFSLALMMLTGVGVRIKIKDRLAQMLPALFYLALNAYLAVMAF